MKTITKIEPAPKKEKKTRVAAYCRVSTAMEEQLISLKTQKMHYEQYIKRHPGWELAGLYYDEGISGTKKETRPALLQMMADCEKGLIDRVVTKSLSRFSRNVTDCLELVRKLLDLGIPIYFEKENLDTGEMESELLLSIMSSLAESESVSISENMKWGMRHQFQNGTFLFRSAPYGYRIEKGRAVIDPQEAEKARQIYTGYLSGLSLVKSAKTAGLAMTHSSVKVMLQNRRYLGDDFYPQIVEKELFDAFEVERQRREERWHGKRTSSRKKEAVAPTQFRMRKAEQKYEDPYENAEYLFSLIEEDSSPAEQK